jgi:hypothetical protein
MRRGLPPAGPWVVAATIVLLGSSTVRAADWEDRANTQCGHGARTGPAGSRVRYAWGRHAERPQRRGKADARPALDAYPPGGPSGASPAGRVGDRCASGSKVNMRGHSSVGQVDADGPVSIDCVAGPAGRVESPLGRDVPQCGSRGGRAEGAMTRSAVGALCAVVVAELYRNSIC